MAGGVLALLLLSGLLAVAPAPGGPSTIAAAAPHAGLAASSGPRPMFGGDLNVSAGSSVTIAPISGQMTYFSGGNINIAHGGTLTVVNTTIVFDNYIGDNGSAANRLSHIFALDDAGTLILQNASITTLVDQLNPFCSLSVSITGVLQGTDSLLEFPGSIVVSGAGAQLWLKASRIAANPALATLNATGVPSPAYLALLNASRYAPSIEVIGGAQATLLDSVQNGTYALAYASATQSGLPPSTAAPGKVLGAASMNVGLPGTATDPATLGLAAVYPTVQSGRLAIQYNATATAQSTGSSLNYNGSWALPTISFPASAGATVTVALPAPLLAAINASGVAAYLAALDSGAVSLTLGASSSPVTIQRTTVSYVGWDYNLTVSGAGSTLTAADTTFAMNWGPTPGVSPPATYVPSNSSKIALQSGAVAYLANISVNASLPPDYANQSFVQPQDPASTANFYRWLEVPVVGAASVPLEGASVQPYYAYPSGSASFNATANALNALSTADAPLAQYAAALATKSGATGYGRSNDAGIATVLVASTTMTSLTLPDGNTIGDYHLAITAVPGNPGSVQWAYASVPPYPTRMQASGPNATGPTLAGLVTYSTYRAIVNAGNPTVADALNPITNKTIAVGQNVTVLEQVNNTGSAPVGTMNVTITFVQSPSSGSGSASGNSTLGSKVFGPLAPGQGVLLAFNWTVDASALQLKPAVPPGGFLGIFTAKLTWSPGNGAIEVSSNVTVVPPYISFSATATAGAGGILQPNGAFGLTANLAYPTQAPAILNVTAQSPSGSFALAVDHQVNAGRSTIYLPLEASVVPGTYSVNASVYSNGRTVWSNISAAFVVPSPTSTSSTPWYEQSILGLPLWLLLVIIAAAVGAVVGLLFFLRIQAKGKVVECGECGAMIPEDATTCSKCGAEFEVDRVRCSRCGSTIPAASQVCPECAATLLGKETEEKLDPERQGYADFVERYRVEGKKALGDSYSDSAFWDWWKRQSTFVPFGQWKLQQAQTSRAGMTAPKETPKTPSPPGRPPSAPTGAPRSPAPSAPKASAAPGPAGAAAPPLPEEPEAAAMPAPEDNAMITCPNCGKESPASYLVCKFCGAVTQ
jgi:hypothetical protein